MSETPMVERAQRGTEREVIALGVVMLVGFAGVLVGGVPKSGVFVLVSLAGASLAYAAYTAGRLDGTRDVSSMIDAALAAPEEGKR